MNTKTFRTLLSGLAAILFLAFTGALSAENAKKAFKCVDAQGRIAYRELALEGMDCTLIRGTPKPDTDPSQAMEKLRQQVETADKPAQPQQQALSEQQQKQKNCATARKNLAILEGNNDVVSTDDDGNKTLLDSEQRNAALAKTRKDIDYWCG